MYLPLSNFVTLVAVVALVALITFVSLITLITLITLISLVDIKSLQLSNGIFVASERQGTQQGVNVNYDARSQKIRQPSARSCLRPANGFNLIQSPGNGPLAGVSIRINAGGTITTG